MADAAELLDTQSEVDAFLRSGGTTELGLPEGGAPGYFDGREANVLVHGDVTDVTRIVGQRSLLVDGDIIGQARAPCRIEVAGDAIITGRICHTRITAESIHIGGSASGCSLSAGSSVAVRGDLEDARVVAGDNDAATRVESCRSTLLRARKNVESLGRHVDHDEKRLDRALRALRIPMNFNVGRIVSHAEGRVCVNLRSFYQSLKGHSEVKLEVALGEFFAKGVVGVVARTNRRYLLDFPAREKVFMLLLRSLRELFLLVADRDRTLQTVEAAEVELDGLLVSLTDRQPRIAIAGRVAPRVEMKFIIAQTVPNDDGTFDFTNQTASLHVNVGNSVGELKVVVNDSAGARTRGVTELHGVLVRVDGGRVRWDNALTGEAALG